MASLLIGPVLVESAPRPMDKFLKKLNLGKGKKNNGQQSSSSEGQIEEDSFKMDSTKAQAATEYHRKHHDQIVQDVKSILETHGRPTHEIYDSAYEVVKAGRRPSAFVQYIGSENLSRSDAEKLTGRYVQSIQGTKDRHDALRDKAFGLERHIQAYLPIPDYLIKPRADLMTLQTDLHRLAEMNQDDILPHHPFKKDNTFMFEPIFQQKQQQRETLNLLEARRKEIQDMFQRHAIPLQQSFQSSLEEGVGSSSSSSSSKGKRTGRHRHRQ